VYIFDHISLNSSEMFQTKCAEKIKTHFVFNKFSFSRPYWIGVFYVIIYLCVILHRIN